MNARQRRKQRRAVVRGLTVGDRLDNSRYKASLDRQVIGVDHGASGWTSEVFVRLDRHGNAWVTPAPRYDDVFFRGVAWLDTL